MNDAVRDEWMTTTGGVSRQAYSATFPPDRFHCVLDEFPMHLVRRSVRREWKNEGEGHALRLNPECVICPAEQIPAEFASRRELLSGFALQGTIAWVRDQTSGGLLPFWLGPESESLVRRMQTGEPLPDSASQHERRMLEFSGVLIGETDARERYSERQGQIRRAARIFIEKGYTPFGDLIHPLHVAALRRYYRYMIRSGTIHLGDEQSPLRYVAHNDPVARFFHQEIASTLSAIAGEPLKPSYVYFASYLSGSELKKHTDREQCEFSVTLCLDFSPEPEMATPWPIKLDTPSGSVTVYQGIGDGLAYRGTKLPHCRDVLSEAQTSTSIFFHYVADHFAGPLD
ncbi:MAG TPA: hypothetical protein VM715_13720 [Candidatus Acidoferrum sp.]|jgi:hypothetical protein|nr:hypothetical protein [Candidatus Acidoferrum sp.]